MKKIVIQKRILFVIVYLVLALLQMCLPFEDTRDNPQDPKAVDTGSCYEPFNYSCTIEFRDTCSETATNKFFVNGKCAENGACVRFSGGCDENTGLANCKNSDVLYDNSTCDEVDPYGSCTISSTCTFDRKSQCPWTFVQGGSCP